MNIAFNIVNVVATAILDPPVNLDFVSDFFPNSVIYDPDSYPPPAPAYIKTEDMEGKISIFTSGKMISVGTKSKEQAIKELLYISNKYENVGLSKIKNQPKIVNIVAVTDLEEKIDLEKISSLLNAIYEPEKFSGARYKYKLPEKSVICTFLIFSSGKVVCLGLKNKKDISLAISDLYKLIMKF